MPAFRIQAFRIEAFRNQALCIPAFRIPAVRIPARAGIPGLTRRAGRRVMGVRIFVARRHGAVYPARIDTGFDAMIVDRQKVDGVVIGLLLGFQDDRPLVVFPGNEKDHAITARSLARLSSADVGAEVALLFEDGARDRPLIVGRIVEPVREAAKAPVVVADGDMLRLSATQKIELRVGKASIVMEADGHITIRGTDLVSHAARSNRIRGGSINLN